ncbi:hypothetical protein BKA65DRAFT_70746 [Rhexocercosporidium sp. MPI-PUGE-AT-0058]|nr:hypothetical protein BKA65DRAFT_70746 [Rhexocercosporidium sp. MPI-PUGE-AT-0058]
MRRIHRKTRNGCKQCKSRRVKCDEKRPVCTGCIRNDLSCSLEFLTPSFTVPRALQPSLPVRTPLAKNDLGLKITLLDDSQEELLHHYTTTTSLTFFGRGINSPHHHIRIWQNDMPQMALSQEFLMQGILAVSALHLSTLQPHCKDERLQQALRSEQLAIRPFRELVLKGKDDDIHAVFAFAGFVVTYVLVQSESLDSPSDCIPSLNGERLHWFHIVRGLVKLLEKNWVQLSQGPFGPLITRFPDPIEFSWNPDDTHLARLHEIFPDPCSDDDEDISIYKQTIDELRRASALSYRKNGILNDVAVTYIWPGAIQQRFLELLHDKQPEALVILAHYCVLLKRVDYCWPFRGVGEKMLRSIVKELSLVWKPWIEWALTQPVV